MAVSYTHLLRREPPQFNMCISVILWNVINTGANIVFIVTEIASATHSLSKQKSPLIMVEASVIPIYIMNCGTPFEKTIIAILIPIPSTPHTIARGKTPNPFRLDVYKRQGYDNFGEVEELILK